MYRADFRREKTVDPAEFAALTDELARLSRELLALPPEKATL